MSDYDYRHFGTYALLNTLALVAHRAGREEILASDIEIAIQEHMRVVESLKESSGR